MTELDLIAQVLKKHDTTWELITSQRRDRFLVNARREIVIWLRSQGWSYPQIGRLMNRDHASIMHLASDKRRKRNNLNAKAWHEKTKFNFSRDDV